MFEDDVLPQILQAHALQLVYHSLLERQVILAGLWAGVLNVRYVRERKNGRTKVKAVALVLKDVQLAADLGILLVDRDGVTCLNQRDGCR
jgi:hypothetical protein